MSDEPPKGPGWSNAPGGPQEQAGPQSIAQKSELDRVRKLRAEIPGMLIKLQDRKGRAERFYPYILIRSILGDHGDRPINVPFWESPDIWTARGDPATAPAIPPDHGGNLIAGAPHTIYAHVWNLGRAPVAGVKVEFYWFDPSLAIDGSHANLIGMTRVELGPRSSPGCHKLVKCPAAWVPQLVNGGHECLVVRASAVGDNISGTHPWDAWADRHVGQRNVHVAAAQADITRLIQSLERTRLTQARVQLIQVGQQADLTLRIAAPHLKADPAVQTHVLAELRPDGSLHLPPSRTDLAGGQAPATTASQPGAAGPFDVPRIVPSDLLTVTSPAGEPARATASVGTQVAASGATLTDLVGHFTLLSPEVMNQVKQLQSPVANQAHVLRIVSFQGDQMIGGYTVIVQGK